MYVHNVCETERLGGAAVGAGIITHEQFVFIFTCMFAYTYTFTQTLSRTCVYTRTYACKVQKQTFSQTLSRTRVYTRTYTCKV